MAKLKIKQMEGIIEAILFTMGDSVEVGKIARALEQDEATTRKVIHKLMDKYAAEDRGIRIIELDGAYQMCTKTEMYEYLIRVASQPKKHVLTDVLLETLSIIAYKQPVTKLEIEKIRGVKSDHAVNKLVEYNLVCERGRLDAPGKPILFGTTEEFLRRFSIHSLDDLAKSESGTGRDVQGRSRRRSTVKIRYIEDVAGNNMENHFTRQTAGGVIFSRYRAYIFTTEYTPGWRGYEKTTT